ncbi:MAG: peptidoglycan-binding protein [Potamolinea sp.]
MDTLAYLHLAEIHEVSTNPESENETDYSLFCQEIDWIKLPSRASMLLIFCTIAVASLGLSTPALALQKGNSSSQVTSLQKKLQAAGYFDGPVTGYYGSLTQAAVMKFQKAEGLPANGIADSKTLQTLESGSQESLTEQPVIQEKQVTNQPVVSPSYAPVLNVGNRSSQVTSLQKKLQAAGYFDGPVTGYYGPLTQAAVMKFQKSQGLPADGVAGSKTQAKLESEPTATAPIKEATPQTKSETEAPTKEATPQAKSETETPAKEATPQPKAETEATPEPQAEIEATPEPKSETPTPAKPTPPKKIVADETKEEKIGKIEQKSETHDNQMKLKKTIAGNISPKSVVHSGNGLFFAQNMMYSHTITVYDREHKLIKTIPDAVDLSKYGYSKFKGNYKGAPVEASFSHDGKYAWVSNYQMHGAGFNNPGSDECSPAQNTDKSFLYRINTEDLNIEQAIQVGSVPKFVATSPDNRLVLVSNWCSWDLSVVDTDVNKEIKRIQLGRYPRGIVVDSDSEKAYVAIMGSSDIAKVDLNNFSVKWLANIGHSPRHLNIDPNDKYLYTTLNGEGTIAKIDLSSGKVLKKAITGSAPRSMTISDDGEKLYVVNYNSNTVSKVRTKDMKVLQTVNVNSSPIGITYDPDTREVWVACYSGSIMVFQD